MLVLILIALQVTACGGSGDSATGPETTGTESAKTEGPDAEKSGSEARDWLRAAAAGPAKGDDRWAGLEKAAQPHASRLVYPHGEPPKEVAFKDLQAGKGPALDEWDRFALKYQRFHYRTGDLEEKSSVHEIAYVYGVGELVDGWETGLKGMRAGGVRELIVPGSFAYGKPNVYVVELLDLVKEE